MNLGSLQKRIQKAQETPQLPKRASIVKMFVDKINKEREGTKWPPVTGKRMAIKLSKQRTGMSDGDLFAFYKECADHKCFSSYFFWRFK